MAQVEKGRLQDVVSLVGLIVILAGSIWQAATISSQVGENTRAIEELRATDKERQAAMTQIRLDVQSIHDSVSSIVTKDNHHGN